MSFFRPIRVHFGDPALGFRRRWRAPMMSDHELWQVKLSEGCVIEMTLDEIDTAFNAGRIYASTFVMPFAP